MDYVQKIQFDAIREVGDWMSRHESPDPVRAAKAVELASIHSGELSAPLRCVLDGPNVLGRYGD